MSTPVGDVIARLAAMPAVADGAAAARKSIDDVLWRRDVRAAAADFTAGSRVHGAQASAALDGADIAVADDSPMGRVLAAAQALTGEVPGQVETWSRAPLQVLAHLHAVAARAHAPAGGLGRPRTDSEAVDDPLSLGAPPDAREAAGRLALLGDLVTGAREESALVVAGIVHGEIQAARPFAWGSGLIARATVRLVCADRGVDPSLFSIPEVGMVHVGRAACARALKSYAAGDLPTYFAWFFDTVRSGAQAATSGVPGEA
ncbi:MAG: oxidoreductase [Actinomycetales bacterium]|nr:oxidoreductase [Actinomycetales bacterium]